MINLLSKTKGCQIPPRRVPSHQKKTCIQSGSEDVGLLMVEMIVQCLLASAQYHRQSLWCSAPCLPSVCSIPPEVRRRVNALKNLQKSSTKLEAEFYKEVQLLEAKYNKLYQSHYKKRAEVVRGSYQPTEEECHWSDDNDQENGWLLVVCCCFLLIR